MVSAQLRFSRWRRSASALAVLSGLGLGAFGCGGGDSGPRDGGTRDSGGPPDLGDGLDAAFGFPDAEVIAPVACAPAPEVQYAASGLPLIETHPGAPVVLYIAYGGGLYEGSSSDTQYGGYNRSGSIDTYDAAEQQDIELSMMHLGHYFAMFDVNVTSDAAVRDAAEAWGWILITEDGSGGSGVQSAAAIGTPANARSWSSGSTVRSENGDRSRRIAHELGHNFRLEHSGVWEGGVFYKWEDWPEWDRVYGPIMGGGGEGMRNGWANGHHEGDPDTLQDELLLIAGHIADISSSADGFRPDDVPAGSVGVLCERNDGALTVQAILERQDDEDTFTFDWAGGNVTITVGPVDVSAALPVSHLVDEDGELHALVGALPAGRYALRVRAPAEYAAIGSYAVVIE
ncbi:MAG: hypothetical protein IPH72_33400 [Sandaracinaceae bacterium]|nr:hypothetical protein [Sandaracinaceae bacterium]